MARKVYENVMAQATNSFVNSQINKQSEPVVDTKKEEDVAEKQEKVLVAPIEKTIVPPIQKQEQIHVVDDMAFAMPRSGRPKSLEGKYHNFTARLREDLYEYAQSKVGKDKEYQSVNDYINRLIARDMLSSK